MNHTIRGIDVHTYLVKDLQCATKFYRDVMELKPSREAEQAAEFELSDGATFEIWKKGDGSWVAGNGVMFSVPDAKAAADHYRSRGAKVLPEIEEGEHCNMAFVEDSEGNSFILHERKA